MNFGTTPSVPLSSLQLNHYYYCTLHHFGSWFQEECCSCTPLLVRLPCCLLVVVSLDYGNYYRFGHHQWKSTAACSVKCFNLFLATEKHNNNNTDRMLLSLERDSAPQIGSHSTSFLLAGLHQWRLSARISFAFCFVNNHRDFCGINYVCAYRPLLLHLLQMCQLVADFLGMSVYARTQQDLPRQDGLRVAALADAGQAQLGVLLHRNEYVAGVQSTWIY